MLAGTKRKNQCFSEDAAPIMLIALVLIFLLASCSGKKETPVKKQVLSLVEVKELPLPKDYGTLSTLAYVGDQIAVGGYRSGEAFLSLIDPDNYSEQEITVKDAPERIFGMAENSHSGLSVLFGALPNVHNTSGNYEIHRFNEAGTFLEAFQLDDSVAQTVFGPVITSSGNYLCWNVEQILLYDQVGNLINKVKSENSEIMAIIASQNYTVAHVLYGEQSGFCIIDPNSGEFGEFMPSDHYMDSLSLCWGTEDILLINTGDALLSYNILTNENENLFNWQITSLDGYSIKCILAIETDKYVCMTSEKIYIVSTESQEVERKVLTVASMGNANLEALAATFNQTNTDYYVEISYYSRTDLQRLNTELMTGNGPDILDMAGMSIPASSTYFEDLLPYIDRDAELQREDFVESILDSMLMNGKLTTILPSFCVQTLAGRTADVGSQSGWSMRDLTEALQKKGSGVSAFPAWLTSGELMLWVCNISNGQFVDWNTMSCQFDSDEFISLLEFCKDMPDVFMAEGYTSDYGKNTLLTVQVFQSASWLDTLKRNYSDDEITYIGFPNSNGSNGSFFAKTESEVRLAIPVQSRNKDAAWAFARSSLLGSYQEDVNGFPIIRSELDKRLSAALLQQDTVLLQEDVDKFSDLIEETTLFIYDDNTIRDIILEEALPYFTGTKTAEEAAAIINSRVSLYLSEHHF